MVKELPISIKSWITLALQQNIKYKKSVTQYKIITQIKMTIYIQNEQD